MNVWRDRLHRWFAPVASRCPLSPNAITLIALGINMVAAACFAWGASEPRLFLVGVGLLVVGGLADAFDGIVARVQNKQSRFGDFLDHLADRVSDTLVVTGWMLGSGVRVPMMLAAIILVMLNGYSGTQIEATWRERNYDSVGRGEFVLALVVYPLVSFILSRGGWNARSFGGLLVSEWLTVLLLAFALFGIAQRVALARRLERQT